MEEVAFGFVGLARPMTDEKLARYEELIEAQPEGPIKSAMQVCLDCVKAWWEIEESKLPVSGTQLLDGGSIGVKRIPLEPEQIKPLDAVTPWRYEVDAMKQLFATMPDGRGPEVPATPTSKGYSPVIDSAADELRNAAHELAWFAHEITSDREPITNDKIVKMS